MSESKVETCEKTFYACVIACAIVIATTIYFIFGLPADTYTTIITAVIGFFFGVVGGRQAKIQTQLLRKLKLGLQEKICSVYLYVADFTIICLGMLALATLFGLPFEACKKIITLLLSYLAGLFTGGRI